MEKRVVVTGVGLISPLGLTADDNFKALTQGVSGIGKISSFDCSTFPVRIAGEIRDFNPELYVKKKKSLKLMNRTIKLSVAASDMAIKDSGLDIENMKPTNIGASLGIEGNQYTIDETTPVFAMSSDSDKKFDSQKFGSSGLKSMNPLWPLTILPNMSLCHIAINYNLQGPNMTFCSLASGGAQAIGEAARSIKRGEADVFIAGGCDAISSITMLYLSLQNLFSPDNETPEEACRPFDRDRKGLVVGEGAGVVVLEELQHALKRGANIYGEVAGYSSSVYGRKLNTKDDLFATSEEGAEFCMNGALSDAKMNCGDIDYINADGQSSVQSDKAETAAIKRVFGEKANDVFISSTKSMTGHLLTASGAAEAITGLLSIKHNVAPPTINYKNADEDCDLDYTPNQAKEGKIDVVMSNTFGLGGENASLILKQYE